MATRDNEDSLTTSEQIDIYVSLQDEGFSSQEIAVIDVLSSPEYDTSSVDKIKISLLKNFGIDLSPGKIRNLKRNKKILDAVARVFLRLRPQAILDIEKNMLRTAADPGDGLKVQAAKLLLTMDGRFDKHDKRRIAADPAVILVKKINEMKSNGTITIEQVTGRVIIHGESSTDQVTEAPRQSLASAIAPIAVENVPRVGGSSPQRDPFIGRSDSGTDPELDGSVSEEDLFFDEDLTDDETEDGGRDGESGESKYDGLDNEDE